MTALQREATIRWLTSPPEGMPRMTVGSGSLTPSLPVSLNPDARHPLATSPAELLAGAIGAIFAWFIAEELVRDGTQARELTADVTLTVSDHAGGITDLAVSGITCRLLGRVPKIGQERLDVLAKLGMRRCVETIGLRTESLAVTVETILEGE